MALLGHCSGIPASIRGDASMVATGHPLSSGRRELVFESGIAQPTVPLVEELADLAPYSVELLRLEPDEPPELGLVVRKTVAGELPLETEQKEIDPAGEPVACLDASTSKELLGPEGHRRDIVRLKRLPAARGTLLRLHAAP